MDWLAGESMCRDLANQIARSQEGVLIREYVVNTGSSLYPCSRAASKDGWKSRPIQKRWPWLISKAWSSTTGTPN